MPIFLRRLVLLITGWVSLSVEFNGKFLPLFLSVVIKHIAIIMDACLWPTTEVSYIPYMVGNDPLVKHIWKASQAKSACKVYLLSVFFLCGWNSLICPFLTSTRLLQCYGFSGPYHRLRSDCYSTSHVHMLVISTQPMFESSHLGQDPQPCD